MFMKDSFIKRRCDKHFLKRWVQGLGSTWTLTRSSLCGTCAGDKYKYKYKCAMWTISSEGDEWIPIISTQDVNKIILKIRAGLGSIEELTLVRPFHSGWPGHLQLQVLKMHLSSLMISLTSLIMSLIRQDLFFYYLRGYAFDITAQQTQVLVDWLNLFLVVWDQNRCEFETFLMQERIIQLYSPIDRHFQCCSVDRIFS